MDEFDIIIKVSAFDGLVGEEQLAQYIRSRLRFGLTRDSVIQISFMQVRKVDK